MLRLTSTRLVVLAALLALADVSQVEAQCRIVSGGYGGYRPAYQSFSYSYPSYSYAQPTYYNYYTPAYETPIVKKEYVVQKVVAQEVTVAPLVVTVPVVSYGVPIQNYGASHYYSVQETYQQRAALRDIVREELRAALGNIQQQQQQQQQQDGPPQYRQSQSPLQPHSQTREGPREAPREAPRDSPGTDKAKSAKVSDLGKDTTTPKALADKVLAAFTATGCLKCHADGMLNGNMRLAYPEGGGYTLAKHSPEKRWMIYGQASTGVMPPAARDDAEKAMKQEALPDLLRWVLQSN